MSSNTKQSIMVACGVLIIIVMGFFMLASSPNSKEREQEAIIQLIRLRQLTVESMTFHEAHDYCWGVTGTQRNLDDMTVTLVPNTLCEGKP